MPSLLQSIKALERERSRAQAAESRRLAIARDPRYNRIQEMFPDEGPFRRELYPKQMEFFEAGATEIERGFMAANRDGKTRAGAGDMT